ncbi:hypothetical protein GF380_00910 [Candidatus Uhrbacteria bacterium]|nr:hypothetical protein [Candidatus Uhrbacteria bacterium]
MSGQKVRNYYVDDQLNRDWLRLLPRIRQASGRKDVTPPNTESSDEKVGRFVTIDGRVIFIGGPGAGGGGTATAGSDPLRPATFDPQSEDNSQVISDHMLQGKAESLDEIDKKVRAEVKEDICEYIAERSGVPYRTVNSILAAWAGSSNGTGGSQIQEEASAMFGVPLSDWQKQRFENISGSRYKSEDVRRVLQAMYEHTQEQLANAPETITLFRGTRRQLSSDLIKLNTLSSFSSDPMEATDFGRSLIEIQIPKSRILCTARTGLGCLKELEVIVLGNSQGAPDEVFVSGAM